jgi:hypothetical protein
MYVDHTNQMGETMRKYFFVLTMAAAAAASAAGQAGSSLSPEAKAAARQQRAADIEYWTSKYDGADLRSGQFNCQPPTLPSMSRTNRQIKSTETAVANWKQCYNGFVQNINAAQPSGKRIPADVAALMTDAEMAQAKAHLDKVYARVAADAQVGADKTMAAYDKWSKSTAAYVAQSNSESEQQAEDMELLRDNAQRRASPPVR